MSSFLTETTKWGDKRLGGGKAGKIGGWEVVAMKKILVDFSIKA